MREAETSDERGTEDPDTHEQDASDAAPPSLEPDTAEAMDEQDDPDDLGAAPVVRGCWACQAELKHQYYEVDAHPICGGCAARVKNPESEGTPFGRFARALTYGCGAGVVGATLYYAILALTGYEVGLVAIAVGFMVGYAVKEGSYGRGGWRYQLIAMAITYVAIVMTYVPLIVDGFEQELAREAADTEALGAALASDEPPTAVADAEHVAEQGSSLPPSTTVPEGEAGVVVEPETIGVFHWVLAIVLALFAPFVFGLENIMGTIILLIGLYEAWKINQRPKVQIEGPFVLGSPLPEASPTGG